MIADLGLNNPIDHRMNPPIGVDLDPKSIDLDNANKL